MPRLATNCNTAVVPRSTRDHGVAALASYDLLRVSQRPDMASHIRGFGGRPRGAASLALRDHGSHEGGGMPPNHSPTRLNRSRGSPGPLRDRLNPSASHQCPMASHHHIECHLRAFGLVRCFTTVSMRPEGGDAVHRGDQTSGIDGGAAPACLTACRGTYEGPPDPSARRQCPCGQLQIYTAACRTCNPAAVDPTS